MRLLFIIAGSKYKGGTEILTANLFAKLNECGFECFLFSNNSYITTEEHIIPFPEKDFEQWINSKGNILNKLSGNYFSDTIFKKMVLEVIYNYGIDWVICHSLDMVSSLPIVSTCKTAQIYHWSIDGFEQTILSDIKKKQIYSLNIFHYAHFTCENGDGIGNTPWSIKILFSQIVLSLKY